MDFRLYLHEGFGVLKEPGFNRVHTVIFIHRDESVPTCSQQ